MLFLFPGTYFWGMSTGFSIVEAKAVAGPKWVLGGYRFCGLGMRFECRRLYLRLSRRRLMVRERVLLLPLETLGVY
jgi:hypothetical protein